MRGPRFESQYWTTTTKKLKPSCSEQHCKVSAQLKGALPTLFSNGLWPERSNLDTGWVRKLPGFMILRSIFSEGRFMNINKNNLKLQVILWEKSLPFFFLFFKTGLMQSQAGHKLAIYLRMAMKSLLFIFCTHLHFILFWLLVLETGSHHLVLAGLGHYADQASHQLAEILLSLPLEYQFCRPGSHHLARSLYCLDASLSTVGAEEIPKPPKRRTKI